MTAGSLAEAITAWKGILGEDRVLDAPTRIQPLLENVSGLVRDAPAVLYPESTEEVQAVVETANRFRAPLYPLSTGRNWGLGSRLPARDGATIVDLSRMTRIHEVNVDHHYAVVEPGVTQGQLHDYLKERDLPLAVNVTGSGRHTSLIGNALERGGGYFASRAEALSGLTVVLGNGRVLHTGFGHYAGASSTHLFKYGIGPELDGLFQQSNFGIVTRAGVDLIRVRGSRVAAVAKIDRHEQLAHFVNALANLRKDGVIDSSFHVANQHRSEISLSSLLSEKLAEGHGLEGEALRELTRRELEKEGFSAWTAVIGLMGEPGELALARRAVVRALRGIAQTTFVTAERLARGKRIAGALSSWPFFRRKYALLCAIEPLFGLSMGIPTDEALKSLYWPLGERPPSGDLDPGNSRCGMLYCLPVLPMEGQAAAEAMDHLERVSAGYQLKPCTTLYAINDKALEAVISFSFDRSDEAACENARRCVAHLLDDFVNQGHVPYRVGIQSMDKIVREDDPFWQTVRSMKEVLDPQNIIAPGRYNLV